LLSSSSSGDERRQRAGEDRGEIVAKRHAAVADLGSEQLGEEACLRSIHGCVTDRETQNDGNLAQLRVLRPQQHEQREGHECGKDRAEDVHGPAAELVRNSAECRGLQNTALTMNDAISTTIPIATAFAARKLKVGDQRPARKTRHPREKTKKRKTKPK
jgi:hypothetical protein